MGRRRVLLALCCWMLVVSAEDTPPGLVSKDSDQDLVAEATNAAPPAQKREAALSNSYGEPLPADAYGPPRDIPIIPDIQPAPVYGVPDFQQHQQTPPGAYGPPSPVVFPSQTYQGPPPPPSKLKPLYGPPKVYGPPKPIYGPPKAIYGPPKKTYGPPKQNLPKATYGAPFKPPKIIFSKNTYGPPKPIYGPPKPIYGPPKATYGPPVNGPAIPLDLPPINLPPVTLHQDFGINNNIDLGLNLPAPIYGTPLPNLPLNLKPNFPIPADTYGPPGHFLGPAGPVGPEIVQGLSHVQYGPPEPDPNPRPPHPGIPAPPTPPHVLYDGWKPIPGVSKPLEEHRHHHEVQDQYGPPPPPPPEIHINLDGNSLPNIEQNVQFSGAQISSGYSSVHQDALANIDLNAIVGGDSNHIDQSKTVFEAHYTESHGGGFGGSAPSGPALHAEPLDTYGAPPAESLSHGPYPASLRQQGAKGLIPPSGIYGVPPGSQYGAPPRPLPVNLPLPYGSATGGGHTGGNSPRHPIKFREPVPDGLLQGVGQLTHHKDHHSSDHHSHGPAYISPPIREVKDVTQNFGNHGLNSLSLSIEPSNLYSLPHSGNPIHFQSQQQPSNLYGSPIDSYSAPLLTVGDHTASGSNVNEVKATLDGSVFANLSNLDAAAILKHCPYHEAILKAAKLGDKIPSDLASSYVASLSSLGSTLSKNQQTLISPQNGFNTPVPGSQSVSYSTKDLSTASQSLVQTVINDIKSEKTEKNSVQKGKSIKDESKNIYKDERLQYVSQQIQQTSEKIKNLSEEAKQLQEKIVTTSQNINQVNGQIRNSGEIPVKGKLGSYAIQIQAADSPNGKNNPTIPHEQLLSEGLLQSILSAIEEPRPNQVKVHSQPSQISFNQAMNYASLDSGGLVLPAGYEPVDHTKFKVNQQKQQGQNIQQQQSQNSQQQQEQNIQQQQGQNLQQQQRQNIQQQQSHNIQQQQGHNIQQQQSQQYQQQQSQSFQIDQEVQSTNKDIKKILHGEIIQKHRGDIPYTECDLKSDHSINHSISVPAPSVDSIKPVDEIDMNDVAIYFDEKKDENEPVTEISVATSISENVDNYKEPEFGDKIVKKS